MTNELMKRIWATPNHEGLKAARTFEEANRLFQGVEVKMIPPVKGPLYPKLDEGKIADDLNDAWRQVELAPPAHGWLLGCLDCVTRPDIAPADCKAGERLSTRHGPRVAEDGWQPDPTQPWSFVHLVGGVEIDRRNEDGQHVSAQQDRLADVKWPEPAPLPPGVLAFDGPMYDGEHRCRFCGFSNETHSTHQEQKCRRAYSIKVARQRA